MTKPTTKIYNYKTGYYLGTADVDPEFYDRISQKPEGIIDAFTLLSTEDIKRLNINPKTTIYCED